MADKQLTHCLLRQDNRFQYAWVDAESAIVGKALTDGWTIDQAWQTVPARLIGAIHNSHKDRAATIR